MLEIVARTLAHAGDRATAMPVVAVEWKRCRLIVVDGAEPVALCYQHVAFAQRNVTALAVGIRNMLPLPVPRMIIRRIDATGGDTTLDEYRPTRLRSPNSLRSSIERSSRSGHSVQPKRSGSDSPQ
jgi:hypothetical protein